jgi:putative SOS response-associated peptidase YedK
VDGFYEWLRDRRLDAETGDWHRTFTIVTTRPNAIMTPIHDRMPVVVPPDSWARWLDPTPAEPGELRALLEPTDDVALAAYAVPLLVNNVRNDGPALIEPLAAAPAPLPLL